MGEDTGLDFVTAKENSIGLLLLELWFGSLELPEGETISISTRHVPN